MPKPLLDPPLGSLYYKDREGNVSFITDTSTNILEQYRYDAFGKPIITGWADWLGANPRATSSIGNRYMFTGREYFSSFGIYDYRHRYYQPDLGRFLQLDPKGFDAGDMNLFRYCDDDPVDKTDPTGTQERSIDGWNDGAGPSPVVSKEQGTGGLSGQKSQPAGNQQFSHAVDKYSEEFHRGKVDPIEFGRALFRDARRALGLQMNDVHTDRSNKQRIANERTIGEYAKGGATYTSSPRTGLTTKDGAGGYWPNPPPGFSSRANPFGLGHGHGPGAFGVFQNRDIPSANGHNDRGAAFIAALAWYGDEGQTVRFYVPLGHDRGLYFHSSEEGNFQPGFK